MVMMTVGMMSIKSTVLMAQTHTCYQMMTADDKYGGSDDDDDDDS